MKYTYLGVIIYEKKTISEYLKKVWDMLNYTGVILVFPITVAHEYCHLIPAKIFGYHSEIKLLENTTNPAYCMLHLNKTGGDKYALATVFLFPLIIPISFYWYLSFINVEFSTTLFIVLSLLTLSLSDLYNALYVLIFGYNKFINRNV